MSRTVMCRKYQQELPALDAPPYPGPKGQDIYDNVSKRAWEEWQAHQTMLINEKHLSLVDPEARKYLQGEMDNIFHRRGLRPGRGLRTPGELVRYRSGPRGDQ